MRRRGFTLIGMLWLMALLLALSLGSLGLVEGVRGRIAAHKHQEEARALAFSGADYARAMLAAGHWSGNTSFTSPALAGGGTFTVQVAGGRITSVGRAGAQTFTARVPVR